MSVQAKLEVVRRKHIVHLTGFGAYSSTCYKGTDNCAGTMGVDQLPSSSSSIFVHFSCTVELKTIQYSWIKNSSTLV